jgi:hypothetical protein
VLLSSLLLLRTRQGHKTRQIISILSSHLMKWFRNYILTFLLAQGCYVLEFCDEIAVYLHSIFPFTSRHKFAIISLNIERLAVQARYVHWLKQKAAILNMKVYRHSSTISFCRRKFPSRLAKYCFKNQSCFNTVRQNRLCLLFKNSTGPGKQTWSSRD